MPDNYRKIFLPYAIMALEDGAFLPVNRKYKPLGISSRTMVDYESHPTKVKIKGLTPAKAKKIGLKTNGDGGNYYLYDDRTNPERSIENWNRYQAILSKLMKMSVSPAK